MANSIYEATGDGSTTDFTIPYTYLEADDVTAFVGGVSTSFTFTSSNVVTFASAPANGVTVRIARNTDLDNLNVTYSDGGALTAQQLNNSNNQLLFGVQEAIDRANESIAVAADGKYDAQTRGIKNVATPTNANDATNKSYVDTSANNAASSAAAALVSQNAAASSATAAANSATASAGSATTSANEATASANSATASANSAATASTQAALATTNGAAQVALATTQANNAASSASTASTQASNASTSASTSTTQATNSANSATASANSATAAAGSASTASTQAALATTNGAAQVALATTQANNAATSATAAANSATAAATSETNAANSAAAAAAAFDNFDDTYLGSFTSDPTTDNDGDPLTQGDLYFNSTANEMRVYDGANWIAASSAGVASLILYEYTATSGQTTFSGADDNSASLSYSVGNIQVVMNGVVLDPSDYTATNGTSVVLATGATTGDLVNIYAFKSFTVADTVSASAGGTFNGNVNFSDNVKAQFGAGSDLQIYHDGSNSYVSEQGTGNLNVLGTSIDFLNSAANKYYMSMSDGGSLTLYHNGGSKLTTTSTGVDVTGTVTADGLTVDSGSGVTFSQEASGSPYPEQKIKWSNDSTTANGFYVSQDTSRNGRVWHEQGLDVLFGTANTERMRIDSSGRLLVYKSSASLANPGVEHNFTANNGYLGVTSTSTTAYFNREDSDGTIIDLRKDNTTVGTIGTQNWGIGTNSPTTYGDSNTKLAVVTPTSNANDVNIRFGTNDVKGIIFVNDVSGDAVGFGTTTNDRIQFNVNNAEKMRIEPSGYVYFNTTTNFVGQGNTSTGHMFQTEGTAYFSRATGYSLGLNRNSDGELTNFSRSGTFKGSININSSSVSYNTTSDYRLKEAVVDMTGAIDRVKALAPKRFNFIADADTTVDGFLAHEAQAVVPEAVTGTKDAMRDEEYEVTPAVLDDDGNVVTEAVMGTRSVPDYQGIDQSKLVPLLTGALREAIAKIEALETTNADLIARIETLENA